MAQRRTPGRQLPARAGPRSATRGGRDRPSTVPPARTGSAAVSPRPPRRASDRFPALRRKAPGAPRAISGRAAALGLLLLVLTLAYAYPVRVYLGQQAEIDQLRTAQAQQRERIADLRARIARWDDPNFVITQARTRLQLVRKGELLFVVQADPESTATPVQPSERSWMTQLWSNVQGADHPDGS